jgi:hypothetical protein
VPQEQTGEDDRGRRMGGVRLANPSSLLAFATRATDCPDGTLVRKLTPLLPVHCPEAHPVL